MLKLFSENIARLFFWNNTADASDLLTPPFEAFKELEKRRKDPMLQKKVEEYLAGDIPAYFQNGPILYLARHIVTPNFETMRFLYLMRHIGMQTVVSYDSKGKFAPHNHVKRALGKLPICTRVSQNGNTLNEQYQNVTIIDFNSSAGKPCSEVKTLWGEPLLVFHKRLFSELGLEEMENPDDADWIDRHHRENLLEHYKHLLALFVVHGIFFENYDKDDQNEVYFVKNILRPAYRFVEERFGYRPLIVQVFPTSFESGRFWISYPAKVLDIVRESMRGTVV